MAKFTLLIIAVFITFIALHSQLTTWAVAMAADDLASDSSKNNVRVMSLALGRKLQEIICDPYCTNGRCFCIGQ